MIRELSKQICTVWYEYGIIQSEDIVSYSYGVELLLSTVLGTLAVIITSAAMGYPIAFLPYILSFIPFRLTAGGYHAKTHWGCLLSYTLVFCIVLTAMANIPTQCLKTFCVAASVVSFVVFAALAPVPAANKPLTSEERHINRKKAIIMGAILVFIALALSFVDVTFCLYFGMFFCGELAAAISLTAAVVRCPA